MNLKINIQDHIKNEVTTHPVIVFIKGSKLMPMCGFSGTVIDILSSYNIHFETRNVLEDHSLRQGIKDFSNWPTIPQLYVNGSFIGGCDIITQLHESGELASLLNQQ